MHVLFALNDTRSGNQGKRFASAETHGAGSRRNFNRHANIPVLRTAAIRSSAASSARKQRR